MRNTITRYSLAGLFTLIGLGAAHSTVQASDPGPAADPTKLDAPRSCTKAGHGAGELARATSAAPSPYWCICCEATGSGSCCSKC